MNNVPMEYFKKFAISALPLPISALLEAIDECKSKEELSEKFDDIKTNFKEYVDQSAYKLPVISMEVEMNLSSIAMLNFLVLIDDNKVKEIEKAIEDFDNDMYCSKETKIYSDCVIIELDCPIEKENVKEDFVEPIRDLLKEFGVQVKSVVFA